MILLLLIGLGPLVMMAVLNLWPALALRYLPIGFYAPIEREYWMPFSVLTFAAGSHLMTPRNRRALVLLSCLLVIFVVRQMWWRLSEPAAYAYAGEFSGDVCLQSTDYTCGAAAMVTLLNTMGIESSEGEMARLSGTIPHRGVSDFQAAWGLQRKLGRLGRPERVEFVLCPEKDAGSLPTPCLAGTEYSFWFAHMVCVFDVDEQSVTLGDPLAGHQRILREEFEKKWLGVAIVARPPVSMGNQPGK